MTTDARTDWDRYYERPFPAASMTRRYTAGRLVATMRRFLPPDPLRVAELGGANSCFFRSVCCAFNVQVYNIVDNNPVGLAKTEALDSSGVIKIDRVNVLEWRCDRQFDLVFSVGLIEHFTPPETSMAIRCHFKAARPGGLVIVTAPTPTPLYRAIRGAAEVAGQWRFPDERPLLFEEVHHTASAFGSLLHRETLWPLGLTQLLLAYRVNDAGPLPAPRADLSRKRARWKFYMRNDP